MLQGNETQISPYIQSLYKEEKCYTAPPYCLLLDVSWVLN